MRLISRCIFMSSIALTSWVSLLCVTHAQHTAHAISYTEMHCQKAHPPLAKIQLKKGYSTTRKFADQLTRELSERLICGDPKLRTSYHQVEIAIDHLLRLAPDEIGQQIRESHLSWFEYWTTVCSVTSEYDLIELSSCAQRRFEDRLAMLEVYEVERDDLLIFPIALYGASEPHHPLALSVSRRHLVYDQVYPWKKSKLSKRTARQINLILRPGSGEYESLNLESGIYDAEKRFIHSVSGLWGVEHKSTEWCVGCNGGETYTERHEWFLRDDGEPLKLEALFRGDQWRSKVTDLFVSTMTKYSDYLPEVYDQDWIRGVSLNPSSWTFTSRGISIWYSLAYHTHETCEVTWDELLALGVSLQLRPQILEDTARLMSFASLSRLTLNTPLIEDEPEDEPEDEQVTSF